MAMIYLPDNKYGYKAVPTHMDGLPSAILKEGSAGAIQRVDFYKDKDYIRGNNRGNIINIDLSIPIINQMLKGAYYTNKMTLKNLLILN
jgi:hypothetical protein